MINDQVPFDIPVVLFIFKRAETTIKTISILRKIKAKKIILVSDFGRTQDECVVVESVREQVLRSIDWDCNVEKIFATKNEGVFNQIGLGAYEILNREERAIFLEDDNLPEESFFYYCKELLKKYDLDPKVLWICGTNYLGQYKPKEDVSYVFTKQLLPCGWASWGHKFCKYYDKTLDFLDNNQEIKKLKCQYVLSALFRQQVEEAKDERERYKKGKRFSSWDYHMIMSLVHNDLYGIAPVFNQIKNTGMDANATHGGTSNKNVMANRLCGMESYEMLFPLKHPKAVSVDPKFELLISKMRLKPFAYRMKRRIKKIIKKILRKDIDDPIRRQR